MFICFIDYSFSGLCLSNRFCCALQFTVFFFFVQLQQEKKEYKDSL